MTVEVRYSGQTVEVVEPKYTVDVIEPTYSVEVTTGIIGRGTPYEGSYEVTPSFDEQVLATRSKTMRDDVTVHEIPVHRVSNPAGGVTVSIGG